MNLKSSITKQIVTGMALTALGTQALAADTDTRPEERRGVVIGALVGASVGGPIGAGAGAIIGGGFIAKAVGIHRINRELTAEVIAAEQEVERTRQARKDQVAALEREIAYLQATLSKTEAVARVAPELPIQFSTASSTIADHYQGRLREIAAAMAARPEAKVKLSGYADRRGTDEYNMTLSQQRVEEVRQFLVDNGIPASRIETSAFGETRPLAEQQTSETDFFDRRVVMQFEIIEDETPLAAR